MNVVVTNVGSGGGKKDASAQLPEDTYQNSENVSENATENRKHVQPMDNNDLENILYTMILAFGSMYCISDASQSITHIILFSLLVTMCIAQRITFAYKILTAQSVF